MWLSGYFRSKSCRTTVHVDKYFLKVQCRVGQNGLQGFEISHYSAANAKSKGEKPAPICLSAIFGKIDEKSRNPVQAFQSNAVHTYLSEIWHLEGTTFLISSEMSMPRTCSRKNRTLSDIHSSTDSPPKSSAILSSMSMRSSLQMHSPSSLQ